MPKRHENVRKYIENAYISYIFFRTDIYADLIDPDMKLQYRMTFEKKIDV